MSDNEFFGGRRRRRGNGGDAFSPYTLFASGEQGVWYDPSDLTPEKVSWRRNLLTYSQDFENAAWTKSNASILSNLALYSQDFNNAWWSTARATISANTSVAPDGTTTADTLVEDTTSGTHPLFTPVLTYTANAYTFSVYVKASGRDKVRLATNGTAFGASPYVNYDLVAVTATGVGGATGSIVDAGNGWYRCIATVTATAGTGDIYFQPLNASGSVSYTGSGAASLLFWGAQIVPGSTAQTYTRSLATAAPVMFSDPLGGTMADKSVSATTTSQQRFSFDDQSTFTASTYTLSVYAKAAEWNFIGLTLFDTTYYGAVFSLTDGTTSFVQSGTTTTATAVGNGWWRLSITANTTGTLSQASDVSGFWPRPSVPTVNIQQSITGDGVSGVYLFGAQLERVTTASAYQRITDFSSDFLAAFPTHALYQESTGVTPVTALGQSVGLVLDKRLGALTALQSLALTNSTFTSGSTGWSGSNISLNTSVSGQIDVTATSSSAFGLIEQSITAPAGAMIRLEVDCEIVSGTGAIGLWTGTTGLNTTFSDVGRRTRIFYAAVAITNGANVRLGATNVIGNTLRAYSVRAYIVPGNHALQATSASRPTLQARSNLLTYTEQFDNAAWGKGNLTVTANASSAPDGTATADRATISASSVYVSLFQQAAVSPNTQYTFSYWLNTSTSFAGNTIRIYNVTGAADIVAGQACVYSGGWVRQTCTFTTPAGCTSINVYSVSMSVGAGAAGNFFDVWGAQLELGSTATTYQRIVTATDYADVGLPRNLTFDGVDDSLATVGNVDFSATDKMSVFSGLTKTSDAAQGIVTELTASAALNTGAFNVQAPSATPATNRYAFESKGSLLSTANVTSATYAAPRTDVVTMTADIGTDALAGRINGASVVTSATDQGTGNFANAVVYVGRRGGTTLPLNGRIFQLIVRGAATDSVTVINAEQYVAQKTGVTL